MKTLQQIGAALVDEIERFQIPDASDTTLCVGTAWSADRYQEEIREMRQLLISPYWCDVSVEEGLEFGQGDHSPERFAVVAKDGYYVLVVDAVQTKYALGWIDDRGAIHAFMAGGAGSTFLAR